VKLRDYFFFFSTLFCFFLSGCGEKAPEIVSIDPQIGIIGEILAIRGSGFGNEKNESYITIAGTPPTSSSYLSWNDNEILVKIPEFGDAGLVYIYRGRKKSNSAIFANLATIPETAGHETDSRPLIISIEPASAPIGSLITIHGSNFGQSRHNSGVFFPWDSEQLSKEIHVPEYVEVFEVEFGYELWSEREIQLRVPDGATSGNLEVRTPNGNSRLAYFEVTGKPGTKVYSDKRIYTLSCTADLKIEQAVIPNAFYLCMPQPAVSASQRNIRLLSRNKEPFMENYRGSSLFQFNDVHPRNGWEISLSWVAEVYAVEINIRNQNPVRLNKPSRAGTVYTIPSSLIPSDDPKVKSLAAEITGRERLPYPKAQRIYEWLISSAGIQAAPLSGGVPEALDEKKADNYQAALLFCALARAVDIPAIPVAGILVNRHKNTVRHYWAEFWLDGFGWVPLDPALGAGKVLLADFNLREDHAQYYFGNMDNQRIAFSRGELFLNQMTPGGRITGRSRDYSLQTIWEEATGGIESYSSHWSDVTIEEVYAR
jgi:transglutaminase-like putative cysteine protease